MIISALAHVKNALLSYSDSSEHEDKSTDASGDIPAQSSVLAGPPPQPEGPQEEGQSPKLEPPKPEVNDDLWDPCRRCTSSSEWGSF